MKTQMFKISTHWLFTFLLLLAGSMSFTSCDLLEDDDEEEDETTDLFAKNFSMKFTRCERVGSVLQIDWQLTNKSGKDLQDVVLGNQARGIIATDNLGNEYNYGLGFIAIENGPFSKSQSTSILKGETAKGTMILTYFDATNTASKVNIYLQVYSPTLGINQDAAFKNVPITDNRVLANGIQTNDLRLTYQLAGTSRVKSNTVHTKFTITNNTGVLIKNFTLNCSTVRENLGKEHGSMTCNFAIGEGDFSRSCTCDIAAGATETFWLEINEFDENSTSYNAEISCKSDNVVFVDNNVRFFNVRVN